MPPLSVSSIGGAGAARVLPKVAPESFLYWDMRTTLAGILAPGDNPLGIKNLGHGGALTLDRASQNGDGNGIAVAGPSGGGVSFGGVGSKAGNLATTLTSAPAATDSVVMSVACRFRPNFGTGSAILFTKSYPAVGAGWNAPFNAFGISLHSDLTGTIDWNVNVGGVNNGTALGGRYALEPDRDYWLDLRKRADGTASLFMQGTKVATINPGLLTDYGAGEWMIGGNVHDTGDTINGEIYFAEVRNADLSDDQILARARAWLGWTS